MRVNHALHWVCASVMPLTGYARQSCPSPGMHVSHALHRVCASVMPFTGYARQSYVVCPVGTSCSMGSAVAVPWAPGALTTTSRGRRRASNVQPLLPRAGWSDVVQPVRAGLLLRRGRGGRAAAPWWHAQERLAECDDVRRSVRRVPSRHVVLCGRGRGGSVCPRHVQQPAAAGDAPQVRGRLPAVHAGLLLRRCTTALMYYCADGAAAALPCPGGTHKNASLSVMTSGVPS
jgi:hypothetical protein